MALFDLDGFKGVNDVYGHAAGDRLLEEVGERLSSLAGPELFIARLGGDEFGAILSGNPSEVEATAFGDRLCALLKGAYLARTLNAEASGTVGLVV